MPKPALNCAVRVEPLRPVGRGGRVREAGRRSAGLDDMADAMDSARASALSGVNALYTPGEVIELRRDAK
jgi:hypothetical protein